MGKLRIILTALVASLLGPAAMAAEKFDPAAMAKIVAPFIETQTVAVVHVDLSRLAIDPVSRTLERLIPQADVKMEEVKARLAGAVGGLTRLGVKDFYLIFSTSLVPPQPPVGLLVVSSGIDAASVRAAVADFKAATKQVGDVLVLAEHEEILAQVGSLKPDARPELVKAFEATGDTAIQVLIVPPKHFAKVIEETLPELPQEIGGGSSTVITRGALWAAIGIDYLPNASAKLVIQSQDAAAAEALLRKVGEAFRFLGGLPETKKLVPQFDQIVPKLMPRVEKGQMLLVLDEAGVKGLLELMEPPTAAARWAANRSQSMNNLKQIALAMHIYHDGWKSFPPAAKCDQNGKPLLSWRVLILPYLDQQHLFTQFHLEEPWDSPHNDDLPFDPKDPLKGLGSLIEGGFHVGLMDGSVRFIRKTITAEAMKALVTPDGGEAIDGSKF